MRLGTGFYIFFLLYRCTFTFAIDDDKAYAYIDRYMAICVKEMHISGIPASIKMAQAILESGAGQSELARKANNHFGMKCGGSWSGDTYKKWDDETVKSCFRVYDNPDSSFTAHSQFLLNPKKAYRYGFLFKLNPFNYRAWASGLQNAGYATSKTYAKNLVSIIERYRLYKLDHLQTETIDLIPSFISHVFPHESNWASRQMSQTYVSKMVNPYGPSYDSIEVNMTMDLFNCNDLPAVYVQANDQLEDIAMRYRVKERQLRKWNELKLTQLETGQILYLSKKRKRINFCRSTNIHVHIVKPNESLYDIAQLYGIRLNTLNRIIKQIKGNQFRAGSVVVFCPCLLKKRG